jgi:hypothetical protein
MFFDSRKAGFALRLGAFCMRPYQGFYVPQVDPREIREGQRYQLATSIGNWRC